VADFITGVTCITATAVIDFVPSELTSFPLPPKGKMKMPT
jgi:hypothetical protein